VYLKIFNFLIKTGRQKILHQMIASILWLSLVLISSLIEFFLLNFFPNNWNLPPFQKNYYQSSYCDLHKEKYI
jgi:hypothetical protein